MKSRLHSGKSIKLARHFCALLLAWSFAASPAAYAALKIEVTEGVEGGVPVSVLPFQGEPAGVERSYHRIIGDDLSYSGLFSIVRSQPTTPTLSLGDEVDYDAWFAQGIEKLVIGQVLRNGEVRFELHDAVQHRRLKEVAIGAGATVSRIAHQISDLVYEELTGVPGIFSTRIAFISAEHYSWRRHKNTLYISDADGHNAHLIHSSTHQLMSPSWSPDLSRLAYVTYENGQPEIVIQTLASGDRVVLSEYIGAAVLPSWSDDGRRLAYVSASDNPDIYTLELESKRVFRVTDSVFIDTEPSWAPDGTLIFTSDRSGSPQLYRVDSEGANPRRITFNGRYNSDASVSPSGDRIAFLSQRSQGFAIVIKDFANESSEESELVFNPGVEGPRFTANGQLLGYITDRDGRSAFGLMTTDGVFGKLIQLPAAKVRGAAWSGFTW